MTQSRLIAATNEANDATVLLRSDVHTMFGAGYLGIAPNFSLS